MIKNIFYLLFFALLFGGNASVGASPQCATVMLPGLRPGGCVPSNLKWETNPTLSAKYTGTSCISFRIGNATVNAGLLCSSTSRDFLGDYGIQQGSSTSSDARTPPSASLYVATGVSSYPMKPYRFDGLREIVYMADIDCDESGGGVYRATSTCNVAVTFLPDGRFLYGSFTLKNHVTGKKKVKKGDVIRLWKSLRLDD